MSVESFFRSCNQNGLIIDTNLFTLLVIGNSDINKVGKHKRVKNYSEDHFTAIFNIANYITENNSKIILTPHILSEISNFVIDSKGYNPFFDTALRLTKLTHEENVEKDKLLDHDELSRLGVSDLSVENVATVMKCAVVTDDERLYNRLLSLGVQVVDLPLMVEMAKQSQ
ncbi:hypothetical protein FWH09_01490 [Candidatus Saccharibacteria bacterium]|nr:hypothetical protein [Candidatus Saccharibacteria bacterium]